MATHDLQGREYARLSALKAGDIVELDDGFTCAEGGRQTLITNKEGALYFICREGYHDLDGQLDDDDDHLIGIYGPITD